VNILTALGNQPHISTVLRQKKSKGRDDSSGRGKSGRNRQGIHKISDQPHQGSRQGTKVNKDDGYYVFSSLDGEQDVTKTLSNSPGLVKRSVGLAPSYHRLPNRQARGGHE